MRRGAEGNANGAAAGPSTLEQPYVEEAAARAAAESKDEEYNLLLRTTQVAGLVKKGEQGIGAREEGVVGPVMENMAPDVDPTSLQAHVRTANRKKRLQRQQAHAMQVRVVGASPPVPASATAAASVAAEDGVKASGDGRVDVCGGAREPKTEVSPVTGAGTVVPGAKQ